MRPFSYMNDFTLRGGKWHESEEGVATDLVEFAGIKKGSVTAPGSEP